MGRGTPAKDGRQSAASTREAATLRPHATMSDVAREAGVGTMTVSRALREPDRVSEQTRKKIEKAIRKLRYVPNSAAGSLRSNHSRIIAVVVPTISHSIFADTLQAMSDVLRPAGYHLLIGHSGYSLAEEEALLRAFLGRRPDAVVLTGYTHSRRSREMLKRANLPVVEIWNLCERPVDTIIGISNFAAARDMTRFLLGKGHGRIGYVGGCREGNDRTEQREAGFQAALAEAGHSFDPSLIVRAPFEYECGAQALDELLQRHPGLGCVFAASDILAVGVMLQANRLGIRVPDQLAVAGFDDIGMADKMLPPLTTVRVPRREIGKAAAENILERLAGKQAAKRIVDLGYGLIERSST